MFIFSSEHGEDNSRHSSVVTRDIPHPRPGAMVYRVKDTVNLGWVEWQVVVGRNATAIRAYELPVPVANVIDAVGLLVPGMTISKGDVQSPVSSRDLRVGDEFVSSEFLIAMRTLPSSQVVPLSVVL